ncbi:MAG: dihydroxyacetone kinase subunit DhaK, partial [bacterium]|nr:dihydroxyacetone kinase subunit DhaK [bacterium]
MEGRPVLFSEPLRVLLYDDIASAPKGREKERRGMAGMTFSFKIAGAMSEEGADRARII